MGSFGYAGCVLHVDLTSGTIRKEPLDPGLARRFIGGAGLNVALGRDLFRPGCDPFSPDNPMVIGAGPLVGTPLPGAAKIAGTTKFALPADEDGRRCVVASGISGSRRFGLELKKAGFDHLVVTGGASKPVYLRIRDGRAEILDAAELWGRLDAYETADALQRRHGPCGAVTIGAAGENRVRFALALTDRRSTLGRNGFGAVMGAKNLKAICVQGTGRIRLHDRPRWRKALGPFLSKLRQDPIVGRYHALGLHAEWWHYRDSLNPGFWPKEKWEAFYGVERCREALERTRGCFGCVLKCKSVQRVPDGRWAGVATETSHFLHTATIGQILGLEDWRDVVRILDLCNRSGLCAVSSAGLLLLAALCCEMGVISEGAAEGAPLRRGGVDAFLALLGKIVRREGLGQVLAEGLLAAGKTLGIDVRTLAGIIKGSPCIHDPRDANMDPRRFYQMVNPRGGDHSRCDWVMARPMLPLEEIRRALLDTGAGTEDADRVFAGGEIHFGRLTRHVEDSGMVFDSLGACLIYLMAGMPLHVRSMAELYSAATGLETAPEELKEAAERACNLEKLVNVREGFARTDDAAPSVWFHPKLTPDGECLLLDYYGRRKLDEKDIERMLDEYYEERGWDPLTGIPTREKLARLGLLGDASC